MNTVYIIAIAILFTFGGQIALPNASVDDGKAQGSIYGNDMAEVSIPHGSEPITAWEYQKALGIGIDIAWSGKGKAPGESLEKEIQALQAGGIGHVRLRIDQKLEEINFDLLDEEIAGYLSYGVMPVLTFEGTFLMENPTKENISQGVLWWDTVAQRYAEYSHLLSFAPLGASDGKLGSDSDLLNEVYAELAGGIRKSNPTRMLVLSPIGGGDATGLQLLEMPQNHNLYIMMGWNFGTTGRAYWTKGTAKEKALIVEKIQAAKKFERETGIPTWMSGWTPKGFVLSEAEVQDCIGYIQGELQKENIPFAMTADPLA